MTRRPIRARPGLGSVMRHAAWTVRAQLLLAALVFVAIGFGIGWLVREQPNASPSSPSGAPTISAADRSPAPAVVKYITTPTCGPRGMTRADAELACREGWLSTVIETFRLLCKDCFSVDVDGILRTYRGPDVNPESWKSDLTATLGDQAESVAGDGAFCSNCVRSVYRKALYVETIDLTERLDKEANAIQPSRKTRRAIWELYGRKCFDCGSQMSQTDPIDHIQPRSLGGTAHFSNLQPLCPKCGNNKGAWPPRTTVILKAGPGRLFDRMFTRVFRAFR
jgi:5-methylcytosine-specific restriction endonuclease McrA